MNAKLIENPIICKKSISSLSAKYSDEIRSTNIRMVIPIMNGHFFNALYIALNCSFTLLNSLVISNSFTPLVI